MPECEHELVETVESHDRYQLRKLILRPEAGVTLPALAFAPEERSGEAYLYLHADGKHVDAAPGGPIKRLVDRGHVVLAVDPRGIGETAPTEASRQGIANYSGPQWKEMYLAYLLGTSYLVMRAEDILVCGRFLAKYDAGDEPHRVHLISIGAVGPAALHAAVLEPGLFASVSLQKCLDSWASVVRTPLATNQFQNVVHGALETYDLPDLRATLPKDKLTVREPVGPTGQLLD